MPRLRLIGLVLMVTSVFLSMAAVATKTSHVRIGGESFFADGSDSEAPEPDSAVAAPDALVAQNGESGQLDEAPAAVSGDEVRTAKGQSREVSVVWPLAASTAVGMLLWFGPAGAAELRSQGRRKPKRRRRRKTKSRRAR